MGTVVNLFKDENKVDKTKAADSINLFTNTISDQRVFQMLMNSRVARAQLIRLSAVLRIGLKQYENYTKRSIVKRHTDSPDLPRKA